MNIGTKFSTEQEEADWWYANHDKLSDALEDADKTGKLKVLTKDRLRQRLDTAKSRLITIRLADADLTLAREQAGRKGLPYQTYIKSLLHQALEAESKKRA